MKILITGATGFIGKRIARQLFTEGHELVVLSRNPQTAKAALGLPLLYVAWNPEQEPAPQNACDGVEAIIHLAGHPVAEGRWTETTKRKIRDSRILGTQNLIHTLAHLTQKPRVIVSASAIGFYGDRGDTVLDESSPQGTGFLADICVEWERAFFQNAPQESRCVAVRVGMVLGKDGGALAKMLPIFQKGLGGSIGLGRQWMSWIHVDDLVALFIEAIKQETYRGIVNGTAPKPVTNRVFTQTLARTLHRPAWFTVPTPLLKLALGEMSTILLSSQRVLPQRTCAAGFSFEYETLDKALHAICTPGKISDAR